MKKAISCLSILALLAGPFANFAFADEVEVSETVEAPTYVTLPTDNALAANDNYYSSPAYESGTFMGMNWIKWGLLLGAIGGATAIAVTHNTSNSH